MAIVRRRRSAGPLDDAADRLNEKLLRAQAALAALHLGVSASVVLDEDDQGWIQALRFGKDGTEWKLFVESGHPGMEGNEWHESPLLSCSREVRVRAGEKLDDLLVALNREYDRQIESVNETARKVESFAERVEALATAGKAGAK